MEDADRTSSFFFSNGSFFLDCVLPGAATNGVVIATEKKVNSILVDETTLEKVQFFLCANFFFFVSILNPSHLGEHCRSPSFARTMDWCTVEWDLTPGCL